MNPHLTGQPKPGGCLASLLIATAISLFGLAAPTAEAVVTAPATNVFIITLKPEADPDAVVRELKLSPSHVYRYALKGFAASLPPATLQQLRQDPRVVAVEADGEIVPCEQTVPTGILRMGITNFPVAHINGQDHRINVDVAVMDTGIQTNHPDLTVVQSVDCTGSGLNGDDWSGHGTRVAGPELDSATRF